MPSRARLIYQYLKLVTFLAVWIALAWSIWRWLSFRRSRPPQLASIGVSQPHQTGLAPPRGGAAGASSRVGLAKPGRRSDAPTASLLRRCGRVMQDATAHHQYLPSGQQP